VLYGNAFGNLTLHVAMRQIGRHMSASAQGKTLHLRLSVIALAIGLAALPGPSSGFDADVLATPKLAAAPALGSAAAPPQATGALRPQLSRLARTLRGARSVKVLAIGSSSTAGVGASSPSRSYPARLEADLESALSGTDFNIIGHGLSGEVAQGAADRMQREVEEVKPDLVIWQVGTNDALRHVAIDSFKSCLKKTLAWLKEQQIDVILINPQYGEALIKDSHYEQVVSATAEIAREAQVLLVDRFQLMRKLQSEHGDRTYLSADNLHMNDEGYRCLAAELAATIIKALPPALPTTASASATPHSAQSH
jgi:acyl-CoA thioesterase I